MRAAHPRPPPARARPAPPASASSAARSSSTHSLPCPNPNLSKAACGPRTRARHPLAPGRRRLHRLPARRGAPARIAYPALTLTVARPHAGRAPAPATRSRPAGAACIGFQRGAAAAPPAAPAAPPRACRAPSAAPGAHAPSAAASTACPPPSCRALEAAAGSADCAQRSPGKAAPLPGPAIPAGPAAAAGARSAPGQLSGAAELADRRDGRRS